MKQGTVCFFIKGQKVMLAKIHYPDGVERWNGVGGVVDEEETPEEAVIREIQEEIGATVSASDLKREYEFDSGEYHLIAYTTKEWRGSPSLKDPSLKEIKWFSFNKVPYGEMWEGNNVWLPKILKG